MELRIPNEFNDLSQVMRSLARLEMLQTGTTVIRCRVCGNTASVGVSNLFDLSHAKRWAFTMSGGWTCPACQNSVTLEA